MKPFMILLLSGALLLGAVADSTAAIDFEKQLKKLAEENAKGYIGPFSTAFGTGMNTGLYQTAKTHGILGFDVTLKASLVMVPDEDLTYDFFVGSLPVPVDPLWGLPAGVDTLELNLETVYPDRETPTVFGEDQPRTLLPDTGGITTALDDALTQAGVDPATVPAAAKTLMAAYITGNLQPIQTVAGVGFDMLPLPMPQVAVGLPMKSEVLLRYLPEVDAGDAGSVTFFGVGVKHSLSQYIPVPMFPVKISGMFAYQSLKIGDLLESNHIAFGVQGSKQFGPGALSVTPYVGIGFESSTLDVAYDIEGTNSPLDGEHVEFSLDGDNSTRMTGGVRLVLGMISINADYTLSHYNAASLGVGLTLR